MITTLLDYLFIFNIPCSEAKRERMAAQLLTLKSLYLHPFEMVMLSEDGDLKNKMLLYEDPEIVLLCPFEIESSALRAAAFSRGILERCDIGYDDESSEFTLCHETSELLEMFSGTQTLLFIEFPREN